MIIASKARKIKEGEHERLQRRGEYLQGKVDEFEANSKMMVNENTQLATTVENARNEICKRDAEIMALKAKLYDFIMNKA